MMPACAPAAGFRARCGQANPHAAAVSSVGNAWSVDNTLPVRQLSAMKGQGAGAVLGLTRAELGIASAIAVGGRLLHNGRGGAECVLPKRAVNQAYLPIVIYIASQFAPDSGAHEEILAHQMRHLKGYLRHLPKVKAVVGATRDARFAGQAVHAPVGHARAALAAEMDGRSTPYITRQMAGVDGLQASIDSPQAYARLSKVCKGDVQFLPGPRQ